jgi:hypothetical protein
MNSMEISPVASPCPVRRSTATHIRVSPIASGWSISSIAAVGCAVTALGGRVGSFLVDGPSSLTFLVLLLVVAMAGTLFSDRLRYRTGASPVERKLVRMAKRIAAVQTVVGFGLISMTVL